ncbi:hypothetical protein ABZZ74_24840 [Streptomyces sp. NPDC006476]|uniref:hypothetical protein n=1 Tax=Streptomyces sp. NPDC006476 TaxID=3157175 RepID=UPI0033A6FA1C
MTSDAVQPCPVADAHRRLMDCHTQWHMLHDSYLDPDGFRLNLNSLVPNLRNVTWLLQKQKAVIPNFATWYPEFQESCKKSEIMGWVVKSRNRITKESDLELLSSCQVVWTRNWLERVEATATFPPRMSTSEIIHALRHSNTPPVGLITVRRKWVDKALPSWELLAATAEAYSWLSQILWRAHEAFGVERCDLADRPVECVTSALHSTLMRLPCMHLAQSELQAHFTMSGGVVEEEFESFEPDPATLKAAGERYGELKFPTSGPIENVPGFMAIARTLTEKDGHHGMFAFLYNGERVVATQELRFNDQDTKMLSFEGIADLVESTRADGIVIISESWLAIPTEKEKELKTIFFPARDRLDRMEGISVYAATRDGRQAELLSMIERGPNGEASCGEPIDVTIPTGANTLTPIRRKWDDMEKRGL